MPQQHTSVDQVKFMSQWFMSWSEMQREDFMPVLLQAYQPKDHLNGLVGGYDSLSIQGRRPSLFDCQMKLFHDWFGAWTEAERHNLLQYLREVDPEFMGKYDKKLNDEVSPEEEVSQPECGVEESHNPPSSVSSPPSTLPRSHSPHDSGLDEPPTDSDHTDPHSLDSSHDTEDPASSGNIPTNNSPTTPVVGKSVTNIAVHASNLQGGEEVVSLNDITNGITDPRTAAVSESEEKNISPSAACESAAEH